MSQISDLVSVLKHNIHNRGPLLHFTKTTEGQFTRSLYIIGRPMTSHQREKNERLIVLNIRFRCPVTRNWFKLFEAFVLLSLP